MSETERSSRRQVIKRGMAAGGLAAWGAPLVQVFLAAPAAAVTTICERQTYSSTEPQRLVDGGGPPGQLVPENIEQVCRRAAARASRQTFFFPCPPECPPGSPCTREIGPITTTEVVGPDGNVTGCRAEVTATCVCVSRTTTTDPRGSTNPHDSTGPPVP